MDPFERQLQRYVDGECATHEAAAIARACDDDAARQASLRRGEFLDTLLARCLVPAPDRDALHPTIVARLPSHRPQRHASFQLGDVVVGVLLLAMIGFVFAFTRSCADVLQLTTFSIASIVFGVVLTLGARPLLRGESGLLARALARRIDLGPADVLVHRVAGLGMVVGGIWLTW